MLQSLNIRYGFSKKTMEHGSPGILGLQPILMLQGRKHIGRVTHRQQGRVRIIRRAVTRSLDIRVQIFIDLGQTITGPFGRRGFQVVQIACFLLKRLVSSRK